MKRNENYVKELMKESLNADYEPITQQKGPQQLDQPIQGMQYGIVRTFKLEDGHIIIIGHWWYRPSQLELQGDKEELILTNHIFFAIEECIEKVIEVFPAETKR